LNDLFQNEMQLTDQSCLFSITVLNIDVLDILPLKTAMAQ